jgi:ribonuclease HI
MSSITIYTDGACLGNPGPGGYGVVLMEGNKVKKLSGGYRHTTNNRMELRACIVGLENVADSGAGIDLFTDSTYVREGITEWIHGWKAKGWKTSQKKPVKNADLWMKLDVLNQKLSIRWHWLKGHAGDPFNELADTLATAAATGRPLKDDIETEIDRDAEGSQTSLF